MTERNKAIEECISIVGEFIKPECSDHTPYRGACVSCGSMFSDDIIREPDELLDVLKELINK